MPTPPTSRKQRILDCAEHHFAEHGFQGGSLSAIARTCGIQNPGLLHHFPSKELLYRAVLELQAADLTERLHCGFAKAKNPEQRLQAFVLLQVEWMHARPSGFRLITRELLDNSERIGIAQQRPLETFLQESRALLEEAQAAGLIRADVPWEFLLTLMLGTLSYAKMVRPTFAIAFQTAPLKQDARWMKSVAQHILQLVRPSAALPS